MNLGTMIEDPTRVGELRLWKLIVHEVKLNISPGSSCHRSEAVCFRVCFAKMSMQTLDVALERIKDFVEERRSRQGL